MAPTPAALGVPQMQMRTPLFSEGLFFQIKPRLETAIHGDNENPQSAIERVLGVKVLILEYWFLFCFIISVLLVWFGLVFWQFP